MQDYCAERPVIVTRGRGHYLYDADGSRYLDGVSSLWCNLFGHRKVAIDQAIRRQLARIAHSTLLGVTHAPAIELARRLTEIAPSGLAKVFYSDDGSTAVEVAMKMAFQYWQQAERRRYRARTSFLTFTNAYHGDTIGSVSLGGIPLFHGLYRPLLFTTHRAPAPYCYRCPLNLSPESCQMDCVGEVESILRRRQREIAALVMEPLVMGAAGMLVQPAGFVKRMRELCDRYGIFLILDEVATGFGRTGRMFACEHDDVRPDFLCLAKGLTAGYLPMAVTLTTDRVYGGFLGRFGELKQFFHGHTYTGNQLGASAALATLKVFEEERVLRKLTAKIASMRNALGSLNDIAWVGDIRQAGLMVGIELVRRKTSRKAFPWKARVGHRVCLEARRHGVLIRPLGDTIVLLPPLSITRAQIHDLVAAVSASVRAVAKGG
ncbi:MAG: adenosylmethionine--8-amino-7-oxononanoate transaminase [Acidobacteria bacterium]|nr:adenosylmethionine--8-amino-7-oxononanoate transaminase [Acidobacteriota bacterium]